MENACEFCMLAERIKTGDTPCMLVHKTENVIVISVGSGDTHYMVIPKCHVSSMSELSDALTLETMRVINELSAKMCEKTGGCRIYANAGDYMNIKHLHWHISIK